MLYPNIQFVVVDRKQFIFSFATMSLLNVTSKWNIVWNDIITAIVVIVILIKL